MKLAYFIAVAAVLLAAACTPENSNGKPGREISAIVNGVNIYMDDVNAKYARLPPEQQASLAKADFLSLVIEEEIIYHQAVKEGIAVSQADVEAAYQRLLSVNNLTEAQLVAELTSKGSTLDEFKQSLGRALAINALKAIKVPDRMVIRHEEVEALYNASGMAERNVTFEEAEEGLVNLLNEKRREIAWLSYVEGLKNSARVLIVAVPG